MVQLPRCCWPQPYPTQLKVLARPQIQTDEAHALLTGARIRRTDADVLRCAGVVQVGALKLPLLALGLVTRGLSADAKENLILSEHVNLEGYASSAYTVLMKLVLAMCHSSVPAVETSQYVMTILSHLAAMAIPNACGIADVMRVASTAFGMLLHRYDIWCREETADDGAKRKRYFAGDETNE